MGHFVHVTEYSIDIVIVVPMWAPTYGIVLTVCVVIIKIITMILRTFHYNSM